MKNIIPFLLGIAGGYFGRPYFEELVQKNKISLNADVEYATDHDGEQIQINPLDLPKI